MEKEIKENKYTNPDWLQRQFLGGGHGGEISPCAGYSNNKEDAGSRHNHLSFENILQRFDASITKDDRAKLLPKKIPDNEPATSLLQYPKRAGTALSAAGNVIGKHEDSFQSAITISQQLLAECVSAMHVWRNIVNYLNQ